MNEFHFVFLGMKALGKNFVWVYLEPISLLLKSPLAPGAVKKLIRMPLPTGRGTVSRCPSVPRAVASGHLHCLIQPGCAHARHAR
jgi:hypothetical protein